MESGKRGSFVKALRSGFLELLVVLVGLVFVRKEVYLAGKFQGMILHWQEYVFLVLMFFDGVLRGFGEMQGQALYLSPMHKRILRFLFPVTLFLYVSCASLCDKLNAACIRAEWWRDLGLLLLLSGLMLAAWARLTIPAELCAEIRLEAPEPAETESSPESASSLTPESEATGAKDQEEDLINSRSRSDTTEIVCRGPWRLLRYPARSALLLELLGVSMSLSAWLPLITLPGLFVLFKWELADQEAFRISQFGQKYLDYKKRSWHLIPYLY